MNKEYLVKRLWNLGYAIREIDDALLIMDEIQENLNTYGSSNNPSNEDLKAVMSDFGLYKRCKN